MKVVAFIFATLIGLTAFIGLGVALDLGNLLYQKETASFRGKSEAERIIERGQSRIQLYNEFFALCSGIQAKERQIAALESNTTMDARKRDAAVTAHKLARETLIANYNSLANRTYTAARFQDSKLPRQISADAERTLCGQ